MKKEPMISVIVPGYNVEKYLAQCLNSLLCQTYKNLEIIIIDDGSADGTGKIADVYAARDKRVRVVHRKNQGLSVSRNNGIDMAKGEYVHFMDADDYVYLDYYEKMIEALADTGADMVAGDIITNDLCRILLFPHRVALTRLEDKAAWTRCARHGFSVRYLFKREFLNENRIRFVPGRFLEDIPFTLAAVKAANMIVTAPGAGYYYIKWRPDSITGKKSGEHRKKLKADSAWARGIAADFVRENGLSKSLLKDETIETQVRLFGLIPFGRIIRNVNKNIVSYSAFGIRILRMSARRKR